MSDNILFGDDARKQIQAGMDLVANAVKVTLGPRGRNVILNTNPLASPPSIVNDGVTVARSINPTGAAAKTGATIIKNVAEKTNDIAGDGTTTATILMQSIVKAGMQQLGNGADAVELRRDIEIATAALLIDLKAQAVETNDLRSLTSVATISCGDEELGKIIATLVHKLGQDAVITLEDNEAEETETSISEGLELRGGILLPIFITNPARQLAEVDDVPIFVTDHDLTNGIETVKLMECASSQGFKTAVIIANSISGEAMATAVINRAQQKFNLIPIRVQAWGETGQDMLRDVAAVVGAKFCSKEEGYKLPTNMTEGYSFEDFGRAERVIATKERTNIIGGSGNREARIKEVEARLPNEKVAYKKEQVKERIAKLKSGVGVISVGAITDSEREEKKLRIEDAINATKAALELGIVPGGGAAIYRAARALQFNREKDSMSPGFAALINACEAPIRQMAINSGVELSNYELNEIATDYKLTIDFRSGLIVDGIKVGIIDPIKVIITALKNASSTAALFLTSEVAALAEESEPAQ